MAELLEITRSMSPRVDKDAGVIRDVKVLGRESKNGREYSQKALEEAAKLYERRDVNLNHPPRDRGNSERSVQDMFGWLEGVEVKEDGVYASLHYATTHPMAPAIAEIAMKNPMRLGMSHNAEGTVTRRDGKNVVESIATVRSVDLVQSPATVNGLFESTESTEDKPAVRKKCRQILEDMTGATLPPVPGMEDEIEVPEPEIPDDQGQPVDHAAEEAKAALAAVFSAALAGTGDLKSVLTQIVDLATSMMGSMPDEEATMDDEIEDGDEEETDEDGNPVASSEDDPEAVASAEPGDAGADQPESKNPFKKGKKPMAEAAKPKSDPNRELLETIVRDIAEIKADRVRHEIIESLESANVEPTKVRVDAVLSAKQDARAELIESFPKREVARVRGERPQVRPLRESTAAEKYPETVDAFVSLLK